MEPIIGKKAAMVLIQPTDKVVETLRLAVTKGQDELLRRTGTRPDLLQKWTNGREWIPLNVMKEACAINRTSVEAPSYSKYLSECTTGAQVKIVSSEGIEGPRARVAEEAVTQKAQITAEEVGESSAAVKRSGMPHRVIGVAVALFIVPLIGAVLGFMVAGPRGAVSGALMCYAVGTILAFLLLVFFPKSRRKGQ